jgi:hypothetical protein
VEPADAFPVRRRGSPPGRQRPQVAAGAERAARAGDDQGLCAALVAQLAHDRLDLRTHVQVERIALVRPVQDEARDVVLDLEAHCLEGHW